MQTSWVLVATALAAVVGLALGWALGRASRSSAMARARTERDVLAERLAAQDAALREDQQTAAELAPLRAALGRVEAQVRDLERDRVEQFGLVGERLAEVARQAAALGTQTATLTGALNSSGVKGTWGEAQLRRVLEHAGMLPRCDFDEQVGGVSHHDARVRPDVVVRLPGRKCLVIDSKAPLQAFLRAQGDGLTAEERAGLLGAHGAALRRHVDELAAKAYWSAFTTTPEMVICFVPSDAVLAAALHAEPALYDHAQRSRVVLASPATLLAVLRAVAYGWKQDSLTEHARELLTLGTELHQRLGTLAGHVAGMGVALTRSVEAYNKMVGTLESRVMVTSRRMRDLGLVEEAAAPLEPLVVTGRPLTAPELLARVDDELEAVSPGSADADPVRGGVSREARRRGA